MFQLYALTKFLVSDATEYIMKNTWLRCDHHGTVLNFFMCFPSTRFDCSYRILYFNQTMNNYRMNHHCHDDIDDDNELSYLANNSMHRIRNMRLHNCDDRVVEHQIHKVYNDIREDESHCQSTSEREFNRISKLLIEKDAALLKYDRKLEQLQNKLSSMEEEAECKAHADNRFKNECCSMEQTLIHCRNQINQLTTQLNSKDQKIKQLQEDLETAFLPDCGAAFLAAKQRYEEAVLVQSQIQQKQEVKENKELPEMQVTNPKQIIETANNHEQVTQAKDNNPVNSASSRSLDEEEA